MPELFAAGRIITTAGALLDLPSDSITAVLRRHLSGDWGECSEDDKHANDLSVRDGGRIVSAYTIARERVLVITEDDRSVTTILLAEEY